MSDALCLHASYPDSYATRADGRPVAYSAKKSQRHSLAESEAHGRAVSPEGKPENPRSGYSMPSCCGS